MRKRSDSPPATPYKSGDLGGTLEVRGQGRQESARSMQGR